MKRLKVLLLSGILFSILFLLGIYLFYSLTQETKLMSDEERKGIPGKFIRLSKGITRYELQGPDTAKTIVLLHGGSVIGHYVWEKNFKSLVDSGFRVLRFDFYGKGYSDRVSDEQTLSLFTSQLKELTDSLNFKKPFNIVGVSMGGTIAADFADKYPTMTDKLILISPVAINPGKRRWYIDNPILGNFLVSVYWYPRCIEKQMAEFYEGKKLPEYEAQLRFFSNYKGCKADAKSAWSNILLEDLTPAIKRLEQRKQQVLLFWGKQDPVIPSKGSEKYIKELSSLTYIEVDRAGHISNYEQPDIINAEITRFLRK